MDEQLKALLVGINALKRGQEETKERMENAQKCHEDLKNALEEKINKMEEEIEKVKEPAYEGTKEISQREENLEKKLLACGRTKNENKFVPASPVPVAASPVSVNLYTYGGKTNWEVYKIRFCIMKTMEGLKGSKHVSK
ncbi:hypothetical protein TNCV_2255271 [Trichonephila clavipes]|nr:hypothetical protein TNCV_2255271 [Trichonephila clavipes]